VLIPVFNEEATIDFVLDAVRSHFDGEVVVIDDGSVDDTPLLLARRSDVTTVRLEHNCGYGCALRIGFDVARELGHEYVVTMDCDGQHEPAHIPQFLEALGGPVDIVSGSRYLPDSGVVGAPPADRREINAQVTEMVNALTDWGLTDAFCGFKAYRSSAIESLSLSEAGYAMPLELWAQAWRAGLRVVEIPVERIYCDRDRSFGEVLDDPARRLAYYGSVWHKAVEQSHE
jgi:dolichol-phosphate mannosyltransferase